MYDEDQVSIVDLSGIVKTVTSLKEKFSLNHFLDLCTFLEGIILYDKLFLIFTPEQHSLKKIKPYLTCLEKHNVAEAKEIKSEPYDLEPHCAPHPSIRIQDAWHETRRLLTAEKELKIPSLALLRQRAFYEMGAKVHEEHSICNLMWKYEDLKRSLENLRNQHTLNLEGYLSVPLPPIAIQVLTMSSTIDAVFENALEVREEYMKLRTSLRELRNYLLDPSKTPFEKNKCAVKWKKSWDSLLVYDEGNRNSILDLATANQAFDFNKISSGELATVLKPSGILNILAKYGDNVINRWKVRALHKTAKIYGTTSDRDIHQTIKKIFDHELTPEDKKGYHILNKELRSANFTRDFCV